MNKLHGFRTVGRAGGAAVAGLLILAGSALGQSMRVAAASPAETPAVDAEVRARALEAHAYTLFEATPPPLLRLARIFEKAAAIRTASDPAQAKALQMAGLMYHHAGQLQASRQRLTEAADVFLAHGDVLKAAEHLISAAQVAAEEGRGDLVEPLVQRAECLLHSPLLNQRDVERQLQRIVRPGTAVANR